MITIIAKFNVLNGSVTFIEEWLNDTAIEQHNNAKHFLQFLEDIKPLTDGDVQIEQLTKVPSVFC